MQLILRMMIKAKYTFITSTMFSRSNGPANFAMNLYNHFRIDSRLLFLTPDVDVQKPYIQRVKRYWSNKIKPLSMLILGYELFQGLKKIDTEVVIWNFSVLSWFTILFGRKDLKHIVFVNDSLSLDVKFGFSYNNIRLSLFRVFEKYTCRKSSIVITNSYVVKNKLVEEYNIEKSKIEVLYKGLMLSEVSEVKTNFTLDETIQISFVKSNYKIGGLDKLCQSLALISNRQFVIHVFGPSEIEDSYYNYANISIKLYSKIPKDELFKEIIKTDIFCVPCSVEAYGQANMEAIALQIPTIILPTNYQMYLHNDSYGYIPKTDTVESISTKIMEVLQLDYKEKEQRAIVGRKYVKDNYDFDKCLMKFAQIIS